MELTLGQALQKGIDAHKDGRIEDADHFYTLILNAQPDHPEVNHNMGVLAVGVGKIQGALQFFKTALEADPSIAQFWLSYIDAFIRLNLIAEAKVVFDQAKNNGASGVDFDQLEQYFLGQELKDDQANILDSIELDEALGLAKKKFKAGEIEESKSIYNDILQKFPKYKAALTALKLIDRVTTSAPHDPPSDQLQPIIDLYTQGQLKQVLSHANEMLKRFPNSIRLYEVAGASNVGLMQFDEAIGRFKRVIEIKPDYAEAYNNLGMALKGKGDLEASIENFKQALKIKPDYFEAHANLGNLLNQTGESVAAIASYELALKIKPDFAEAYNNMGIIFNQTGDSEAAIKSYKQALEIKPDFAEAYNNMGLAFNNIGDLEKALDSYVRAVTIKPNYAEPKANLVEVLTTCTPTKESQNLIVRVNETIRKLEIKDHISTPISDGEVVNLFSKASNQISKLGLELTCGLHQTYQRNSTDLNCKRHMSIFEKHNIIPEFCFGCYKVQVEPRSILDLIKLYLVFNQLELDQNNTRKCLIELRPEISGFYKGLIYCSGLEQAVEIAEHIDTILTQSIGSGLKSKIKRGCSEYPVSFPDYKEINNLGPQLMTYNENWRTVEENYDRKTSALEKKSIAPSQSGMNLSDIMIIHNWIAYARGIGDPSVDLINYSKVYDQGIYDLAKARLNRFHFS